MNLYCQRSKSFLNANRVKFYRFKTKDTEIKQYLLCLGNNTKCFTVDKTRKGRLN